MIRTELDLAGLEQVVMTGQHHARPHDVQVPHQRGIDLGEPGGEKIGLVLVIAFEGTPGRRNGPRPQQLRRGWWETRLPLA